MTKDLSPDPMEGIAETLARMAQEEFGDLAYDEYVASLRAKITILESRNKYLEELVKQQNKMYT